MNADDPLAPLPVFRWTQREFDARRLHAWAISYQRGHGHPPTLREMQWHLWPNVSYFSEGRIGPVIREGVRLGLLHRARGERQARTIIAVEPNDGRAA